MPAELREKTATLGYSPREIEPTLERLLDALEPHALSSVPTAVLTSNGQRIGPDVAMRKPKSVVATTRKFIRGLVSS